MSTLAVICKAPEPGRVKTRLCPPCTAGEAARLAEAALRDTFDAVRATPCDRRIAVLDGAPGPWLGTGIEVLLQRGDGLDERLAYAFEDLGGPTLIIGMDTPQVTPCLLGDGLAATAASGAALGLTEDGGYWAIGLARADPLALLGVAMSTSCTGALQQKRLVQRGLCPVSLPRLVDVDDIDAARLAAAAAPQSRFAAELAILDDFEVAA